MRAPRSAVAIILVSAAAAVAAGAVRSAGSARGAATVTVRRYVLAEPSQDGDFVTELDNGWVNETVSLTPSQTALVLVDVWDDHTDAALSENEAKRLLPLLDAARKAGMLIIHAPSEAPEWSNITVLPGEVLVTGTNGSTGSASRCDRVVLHPPSAHVAHGPIMHVLVAGYDANRCVVDKPCGVVALSAELAGHAEILLVRDATRGQYDSIGNDWYGHLASVNMLELGWWLGSSNDAAGAPAHSSAGVASEGGAGDKGRFASVRNGQNRPTHADAAGAASVCGVRSLTTADLLVGLGQPAAAASLAPLLHPTPSADEVFRATTSLPASVAGGAPGALVVVSCSSDWGNDGFRSRVAENRHFALEPLLAAYRATPAAVVIHAPNGHVPDGACAPLSGEFVVNSTAAFDAVVASQGVTALFYAGYAANTDVLFGVGGMARYYSMSRYLGAKVPYYAWVQGATVAVETPDTLGGRWGEKFAMAYRNFPVVSAAGVRASLCSAALKDGPVFFTYPGVRAFSSPADPVTDASVDGACGPSMLNRTAVTISLTASVADLSLTGRKALCFVKSVGTPYAVYQVRLGDDNASTLLYQTANATGWTTLKVPNFFTAANQTVNLTVVHNGTTVVVYRNGAAVAGPAAMLPLDYAAAKAMVVGARKVTEFWVGELGNVVVRAGAYPPEAPPGAGLAPRELAALQAIHDRCGGAAWAYRPGTDAVGGGWPWTSGDPCATGWFGVKCDADGQHVVQLFPNTRFSGNPLDGCVLPDEIGDLASLEHLYLSNDRTPSHLLGPIPRAVGNLTRLRCVYFSHTGVTGEIPREMERLTNLEVFLARCNNITGPLIDFSKLPHLRNVWFDSQPLTGNLTALGLLKNLTYLQASGTGVSGLMPPRLCEIACDAEGTAVECDATLPQGCCKIASCGHAPKAPPPPPASMGECFPQ